MQIEYKHYREAIGKVFDVVLGAEAKTERSGKDA